MMAQLGARPGGQISFEQFKQAHMRQQSTGSVAAPASKPPATDPATERELRAAFDQFDLDRSGFISANELKGAMRNMGQVGAAMRSGVELKRDTPRDSCAMGVHHFSGLKRMEGRPGAHHSLLHTHTYPHSLSHTYLSYIHPSRPIGSL